MKKYALGVVGTGLIGGSMAIDLRRRGFAGSVLGVEADPVAAAAAEKLGIVDRVVPLEECRGDRKRPGLVRKGRLCR